MKCVMPGLGDTFRPAADSFARARLSSFQTRRRVQAGSRSRLCSDKSLPTLSPLHSTAQRFPGREAPASSPGFSQARPGGPTSLTTTNPSPGQSFSRRKRDETKLVVASSHPGALFPMGRRPRCPPRTWPAQAVCRTHDPLRILEEGEITARMEKRGLSLNTTWQSSARLAVAAGRWRWGAR
jgi:hypothetical protein